MYCLLVFIYSLSLLNNPNAFNGHQNYFSGISLELLRAEYYSRLRIFDNYPLEWGRYHFFNGSINALPQMVLGEQNLITFTLAKISIISFMTATICELSIKSKVRKPFFYLFSIGAIYIFTMLPVQIWWSILTNAFSSIIFLIIFFQLMNKNCVIAAFFYVLCFGLSTSRSLLPATFLSVLLVINYQGLKISNFKKYSFSTFVAMAYKRISRNLMQLIACLVVAGAILVMVISGQSISSPFEIGFKNYLNQDWIYVMSPAMTDIDIELRKSEYEFLKPNIWWHFYWLFILIIILLNKNKQRILFFIMQLVPIIFKRINIVQKNISILLLLLTIICLLRILTNKLLLFYYFFPVTLAILLSPPKLRVYVATFAAISIGQIYFFKEAIGITNFYLIDWLVLFGFLNSIKTEHALNLRQIQFFLIGGVGIICLIGLPLSPLKLFYLNHESPNLDSGGSNYRSIYSDKNQPVCFRGSDADAALAAAAGFRVYYSQDKTVSMSVSKNFGIPNEIDLDTIKRSCK